MSALAQKVTPAQYTKELLDNDARMIYNDIHYGTLSANRFVPISKVRAEVKAHLQQKGKTPLEYISGMIKERTSWPGHRHF